MPGWRMPNISSYCLTADSNTTTADAVSPATPQPHLIWCQMVIYGAKMYITHACSRPPHSVINRCRTETCLWSGQLGASLKTVGCHKQGAGMPVRQYASKPVRQYASKADMRESELQHIYFWSAGVFA